jgi:hypothetical protein
MYQEHDRWQNDFALKLAEFRSTSHGQADKVAQQFAIGVLMLDASPGRRFFQRAQHGRVGEMWCAGQW